METFTDVRYALSSSIDSCVQRQLTTILNANGAVEVTLEMATHIISLSLDFESRPDHCAVVSPYWVERSQVLGALQECGYNLSLWKYRLLRVLL
jgi:hypothetical protein